MFPCSFPRSSVDAVHASVSVISGIFHTFFVVADSDPEVDFHPRCGQLVLGVWVA